MRTSSGSMISLLAPLLALGTVLSAYAQGGGETVGKSAPKTEIGGHVMSIVWGRDYTLGRGVRVSRTIGRGFSFEVEADSMGAGRDKPYADELTWIYSLQAKHVFAGRAARTSLFATYGATGWAERSRKPSERIKTADGTFVIRERWGTSFCLPVLPTIGFGGQHVLMRFLAVRVEGVLMFGVGEDLRPVTGRLSVGGSVPVGGYRRSPR